MTSLANQSALRAPLIGASVSSALTRKCIVEETRAYQGETIESNHHHRHRHSRRRRFKFTTIIELAHR